MIARNLISDSIYPANIRDTVDMVIDQLEVYRLNELPVMDENDNVIGMVTMSQLMALPGSDILDTHVFRGLIDHVAPIDHIFDVIKKLGEKGWSMMPILNKEGDYRGLISQEDIFRAFATSFSIRELGALLVIETKRSTYSMSEIAQIVESENASIISSFLSDGKDTEHLRITLKLNRLDLQFVAATFERYGYEIVASFTTHEYKDALKERYDHLMTYLNV